MAKICREQGGKVERDEGHELGWTDTIGGNSEPAIIRSEWLQDEEISEPGDWNPSADLTAYLNALYDSDDYVGIVTESWQNEDGKHLPKKGIWDRTAGQLIQKLATCKGDIAKVVGDWDPNCGAWIRFNPLDGKGCRDENVTDFRFALVESDTLQIERQLAIYRELDLPAAAIVHSGGKSLHAIVKIEATDMAEYRNRVDYLYRICKKAGLEIDRQNRNPSRLSRMPGAVRNGRKQWLVSVNTGKTSFVEWKEHIESLTDDLPDIDNLGGCWDKMPDLAPTMIEGILRQGHKCLISGPSKAGKSFLLINLSISIAEGRPWLSWDCKQGRVLYINLELDRASCLHRFREVYNALGYPPENLQNIDIWNLRGYAQSMDKLVPKLIRRALKTRPDCIIIDPIYKVITGDENAADQMAKFCNQFDRICTELHASVVYCHHHSKGDQGQKRAHDRASGSGVFARDPDALLDMIQLDLPDDRKARIANQYAYKAMAKYLDKKRQGWRDEMEGTAQTPENLALKFPSDEIREISVDAREKAAKTSAWRIEGILREFPEMAITNMFFGYPLHTIDHDELLTDAMAAGEERRRTPREAVNQKKEETIAETMQTFEELKGFADNGIVTVDGMAEHLGINNKNTRTRIKNTGKLYVKGGMIFEKNGEAKTQKNVTETDKTQQV
jgi:RecA-family ATPase